jgi:hypothetical protein
VALLTVGFIALAMALASAIWNPATAEATQSKPWICHPVNGAGETKTGWDLIDPADPSVHMDENGTPDDLSDDVGVHSSSDGRTDVYATSGACPGGGYPSPSASQTLSSTPSITPSSATVTPSVTPSSPTVTPSTPTVTPSSPTATPTPTQFSVSPTPSGSVSPSGGQSATPSSSTRSPSTGPASSSSMIVPTVDDTTPPTTSAPVSLAQTGFQLAGVGIGAVLLAAGAALILAGRTRQH